MCSSVAWALAWTLRQGQYVSLLTCVDHHHHSNTTKVRCFFRECVVSSGCLRARFSVAAFNLLYVRVSYRYLRRSLSGLVSMATSTPESSVMNHRQPPASFPRSSSELRRRLLCEAAKYQVLDSAIEIARECSCSPYQCVVLGIESARYLTDWLDLAKAPE